MKATKTVGTKRGRKLFEKATTNSFVLAIAHVDEQLFITAVMILYLQYYYISAITYCIADKTCRIHTVDGLCIVYADLFA